MPEDYDDAAACSIRSRGSSWQRIDFRHGGRENTTRKYPDGIPTTIEIEHGRLGKLSSGLVMYPEGHAKRENKQLDTLLGHKFGVLASLAVDDVDAIRQRFSKMAEKEPQEIADLYDFEIKRLD